DGVIDLRQGINVVADGTYGVTSPPVIASGLVIVGSSIKDNQRVEQERGVVRAFDVRTGALAWSWDPIPRNPGDPGWESWPVPEQARRTGGANAWAPMSVDHERGLVFVPTGSASPDYYGGLRLGTNLFANCVVALHAATGEIAWHYQLVHHDLRDYDTPAQPTLIDLEIDGVTVPALVQVTKMGMTFVLNRETGVPLYPVEERPVPQDPVPGEYLSPTQPFPTHLPHLVSSITPEDAWGFTFWDRGVCRDRIAELRNEGIYTPPSLQGSILMPTNGGGNNWGSPAIDPDRKLMVVITWRMAAWSRLIPRKDCPEFGQTQAGTPYCVDTGIVSSPLGVPCTEPPWATIDAIDLVSGELLWSVPLGTTRNMAPFPFWWIKGVPGIGGLSITTSGLVFIGAANEHKFRALSAATGETLWEADLPTAANSTPMIYQLRPDGRQYVVVAAGGHWSGVNPPGDHLMAFALPE
ncbi:MAG: PQQ-binding-like beta-propeller repeat protein, partial [Pseudomonadales bacterium]|nr:PQQ-binding-like beta-propeller repeat protein [Pseudomonadales bacterium]